MQTKIEITNKFNELKAFIKSNMLSMSQIPPSYNREILGMENNFYSIVEDLSSQFTVEELHAIKTDLLFSHGSLKKIYQLIEHRTTIGSPANCMHFCLFPLDLQINYYFDIKGERIDKFENYIRRRIDGIKKEMEENQSWRLQTMATTVQFFNEEAVKLDRKMMALDKYLSDRQEMRQDAMLKKINIIFDGV